MEKVARSACKLIAQVFFLRAVIIFGRNALCMLPVLFHRVFKRYIFKSQNLIKFIVFTALSRTFISKNSLGKKKNLWVQSGEYKDSKVLWGVFFGFFCHCLDLFLDRNIFTTSAFASSSAHVNTVKRGNTILVLFWE